MKYTIDYFIEKFSAIAVEDLYRGGSLFGPGKKSKCMLAHCGVDYDDDAIDDYTSTPEADALIQLFKENGYGTPGKKWSAVYEFNDSFNNSKDLKKGILKELRKFAKNQQLLNLCKLRERVQWELFCIESGLTQATDTFEASLREDIQTYDNQIKELN